MADTQHPIERHGSGWLVRMHAQREIQEQKLRERIARELLAEEVSNAELTI